MPVGPSGGTFSLAGLRLPLSTRWRNRPPGGTSPLPWSGSDTPPDFDSPGGRRWSRRGRGLGFRLTVKRVLQLILGILLIAIYFFWRHYELHVEIQLYTRNWISKAVLPTAPLSSTCFNPSTISSTSYNITLAKAPAFIDVQAGIGMSLGDDCYNFASAIPIKPSSNLILPQHTIYHTYWRADLLPLGRRHVSLLHSLLAMQDRETTSVILWTNSDIASHLRNSHHLTEIFNTYGTRFTVQKIDKRALAKGTPMQDSALLEMADKKAWLDGDLVRVLVMWAKGGIWVDMDTIMTGRDMRVLQESEWVTQWDCYDKVYTPMNGAMMHFYQNSPFLCEMLYTMANDPPPRQGTTDWGALLYHKVWRRLVANAIVPFKVLPYCFTDGRSCRLDNRLPDPFEKKDSSWGKGRALALRKKVGSVWAVHLHNQWEKDFPTKGWVKTLILKKVDEARRKYRKASIVEFPPT